MEPLITEEWLNQQTPEAREVIRILLDRVAALEAELAELKSQVKKLTPRNSSTPPSTEHPHAKANRSKKKTGRKPGGQWGHRRHERTLIPSDECTEVITHRPADCRRCGSALKGRDPQPLRHQVWELPEIRPLVVEHRLERLRCAGCGETTCATLPAGVPRGQSGPRLAAFTGLLMGHFRQSKRRAACFLQDLLKLPCSAAWTVKMQNQVAAALREPYEELRQALEPQPQLHMDESPTKQGSQKAWLWTAVAGQFAVFAIFASRSGEALPKLLGTMFTGIIHCDRAKMYWQAQRLQWCWAHLKRDIQALIDHPNHQAKRMGHDLMRSVKLMFQHWRRYRTNEISWMTFRRRMKPIRQAIEADLLRGAFSGNRRLTGMCRELYDHRDWLWTFVDQQGIEPTNNTAERALRPAVIQRKLTFGTQSESGSRFVERMLTMSETCRLQNRSIFDYLVSAVEAHFQHRTAPSLLPRP